VLQPRDQLRTASRTVARVPARWPEQRGRGLSDRLRLVLAGEDSGPSTGPRFAAWRALQRAGLWPQRTAAAAVTAVALH